jgi:hypothetical protein
MMTMRSVLPLFLMLMIPYCTPAGKPSAPEAISACQLVKESLSFFQMFQKYFPLLLPPRPLPAYISVSGGNSRTEQPTIIIQEGK